MHLDVSAEVLLSQLGYTKTENSLSQAQKMIDNTKGFEKFSKHIISLHDHIKKMNAYVGLSNKTDFFKIKCDENDAPEILEEFHQEVEHWSNKYNVALERLDQKPIYYILGTKAD
jgi:protein subunit release factor A